MLITAVWNPEDFSVHFPWQLCFPNSEPRLMRKYPECESPILTWSHVRTSSPWFHLFVNSTSCGKRGSRHLFAPLMHFQGFCEPFGSYWSYCKKRLFGKKHLIDTIHSIFSWRKIRLTPWYLIGQCFEGFGEMYGQFQYVRSFQVVLALEVRVHMFMCSWLLRMIPW